MSQPLLPPDRRRRRSEPVPIGDVIDRLRKRLADRGIAVDGDIDWDAVEAETYAEWHAERDALRRSAWAKVVPAEFVDAAVIDLTDDARPGIERWLAHADPKPNLVVSGPVGVGKTHAAYALGNAAVDVGVWVTACTTHELIVSERPGGDKAVSDRVRTAPVAILDDLGVEPASEWAVAALTDVIDERLRERRATVITTNSSYGDLAARYGERIMSRLVNGRAIVVRMTGDDRRAQKF